ncbi:MAG: phosphoribosylamine--glycine ligase, partial [Candidatus Tectomicrobia bacterium]|nr:phosphoribosylamine--glycine ligase [Candidatus Tectomicrobia bacterium]
GMRAEGCPYKGILYAGLMIVNGNPKVIEYNARLGDPEAQPILARMESDLLPILEAVVEGNLAGMTIQWKEEAAVCVVMASKGYPGAYEVGKEISGLDQAATLDNVIVFHAGTARKEEKIVTAGGRVLGVTGLGSTISQAIESTYEAVRKISFEGAYYRTDIGRKALINI